MRLQENKKYLLNWVTNLQLIKKNEWRLWDSSVKLEE